MFEFTNWDSEALKSAKILLRLYGHDASSHAHYQILKLRSAGDEIGAAQWEMVIEALKGLAFRRPLLRA
jgi:hypothetical protein